MGANNAGCLLNSMFNRYCSLFGVAAVEAGRVGAGQLKEALKIQREEKERGNDVRLLATICFDKGWMTSDQIDEVLNIVLRACRCSDATLPHNSQPEMPHLEHRRIMRFSNKVQFAVVALLDIVIHKKMGVVSLPRISRRLDISLSYLEHIFSQLRRKGLVDSIRGADGGYCLARPADQISVGDIVIATEQPRAKGRDEAKNGGDDGRHSENVSWITEKLWVSLEEMIIEHLYSVSLQDLADRIVLSGEHFNDCRTEFNESRLDSRSSNLTGPCPSLSHISCR